MNRRTSTTVASLLLVGLLGLTACAGQTGSTPSASTASTAKTGKHRISGKSMCEAHGGTFNATTQHCTYSSQPRPVSQSCQAQGGYYDTAAGFCEMGPP